MLEVFALNLYANSQIQNYYLDMKLFPYVTLAWIVLSPFWRDLHFYIVHRAMHKWNTKYIPDIGNYLYIYAHSLHHKSRNIQPWSGISMHPIEGMIYESACLVPCLFFHHPLMINIIKVDLTLSAVLGHDGHDFPGSGDWFHYLHHTKTDCNYGSPNAPLDWVFGSIDYGD